MNELVKIQDSRVITTSLQIAEAFGKLHKNVIRDIAGLESPAEFNRLNFEPVEYSDAKGEKRPMYNITRDGFTLLAMGFTGRRAMKFKIAYINAFNQMEAALLAGLPKPQTHITLKYEEYEPDMDKDCNPIIHIPLDLLRQRMPIDPRIEQIEQRLTAIETKPVRKSRTGFARAKQRFLITLESPIDAHQLAEMTGAAAGTAVTWARSRPDILAQYGLRAIEGVGSLKQRKYYFVSISQNQGGVPC